VTGISGRQMASTPMNELQELELNLKKIALHSVTLKETLSKDLLSFD